MPWYASAVVFSARQHI